MFDDVAERGIFRVNLRDVGGGDFDGGGNSADFELGVEGHGLVNRQGDLREAGDFETGLSKTEIVNSGRQAGDGVGAGVGGGGGTLIGSGCVGGSDGDRDDGRTGSIEDRAGNFGGLCAQYWRRRENSQKDEESPDATEKTMPKVHVDLPVGTHPREAQMPRRSIHEQAIASG